MYVFFDTECKQDFQKHDGSFEHFRNIICARQMCSKCEVVDDMSVIVSSLIRKPTCFGRKTPKVKLLTISGSLDSSRTRYMSFHTTFVDTTHSL